MSACTWSSSGRSALLPAGGSTWKRTTWRPRTLSAEEWIDNPFSGERYALMHQIGVWLINAQVESAEKSGTEFGRPIGPYGKIYVKRREHTKVAHPEWTKQHARMDAIRVAMKAFLKDLWMEWNRLARTNVVQSDSGKPEKKTRRRGQQEDRPQA